MTWHNPNLESIAVLLSLRTDFNYLHQGLFKQLALLPQITLDVICVRLPYVLELRAWLQNERGGIQLLIQTCTI